MDLTTSSGTTIFRKTAKGLSEIETRANRLSLKLRSVLIMVDGRLPERDLRKVVGEACDSLLQELQSGGYIEPVGGAPDNRPVARPAAAAPWPWPSGRRAARRVHAPAR